MSSRQIDELKTYRIDKENPVVIVSSTQDLASQNIAENLVAKHGFSQSTPGGGFAHRDHSIRLVTVEKPCIYIEPTDLLGNFSSIIFASKHVSAANRPAMTVHATGNLTKNAEFGGRPEELSFVDPARIQRALRRLRDGVVEVGLEIDVTMEATHHGPTSFPIPVCFVEIGSGPREWVNPALGGLAADAIMEAATGVSESQKPAIGFGGTHYSTKFNRICLEGEYQIGHIVPRHAFESGISDAIIKDTIRKTRGNRPVALVDWKGLTGSDRRRLVANLESWEYDVVRC